MAEEKRGLGVGYNRPMRYLWAAACVSVFGVCLLLAVSRPPEIPFEKHTLDLGANETCAFADVNGDGRLDVISGENWYEAPKWVKHHFRDLNFANNYIDDFSDLPIDVNGDGLADVVTASWFSKSLSWWENPGTKGGSWKEHEIQSKYPVEFAFLVDLQNTGKARDLLPQFGDGSAPLTWYELTVKGDWEAHIVSPKSWGHGIGVGDVNGDGRNDILTPKGWFEAPTDPHLNQWYFHQDWDLGQTGFLQVMDVNGDGRPDVVGSMAHDYGVFWLERTIDNKWTKHMIDASWSQAHALSIVDFGGGRKGLLTGKRYMAHDIDPGAREPLGIYFYEMLRSGGSLQWVRHVVDYSTRTGAGMQIAVADYDGDGDLDFAVGGKSGLYLFENLTKRK